jgi:TrmH family RNA methyltransferase
VKALLGSRGKKIRQSEKEFIADGIQSVREVLSPTFADAPELINLYVTEKGYAKLQEEIPAQILEKSSVIHVADSVMNEMAETESPQGILALCKFTEITLYKIKQREAKKIAYFWEIQDPGNSGTVIRTAEALGFDAVIFSKNSVDVYSPKTVRATVGALWHIPVVENIDLEDLIEFASAGEFTTIGLAGDGEGTIVEVPKSEKTILIFGNEARGLPDIPGLGARVAIPMKGKSESLNVASAAAIAMFEVGIR